MKDSSGKITQTTDWGHPRGSAGSWALPAPPAQIPEMGTTGGPHLHILWPQLMVTEPIATAAGPSDADRVKVRDTGHSLSWALLSASESSLLVFSSRLPPSFRRSMQTLIKPRQNAHRLRGGQGRSQCRSIQQNSSVNILRHVSWGASHRCQQCDCTPSSWQCHILAAR